jgi:HD-GYP domain-containing protein (c-di-GMP phosphodiesterase class II)
MTATNSEAQALRYAEELSGLITRERGARRQAEAIAAELQASYVTTVRALAAALDLRDDATGAHAQRVTALGLTLARAVAPELLVDPQLEFGFLLHDVGKIGVPDSVLLKQDRLTKEERTIMNAHPVLGAEIIAPVRKLAPELPIIRHHHEWYNGSGYPDRLMGDEIPRLARILHVADAFEAMTAARPYRMKPLTSGEALGELRKFSGIQFDPVVVDAFVRTRWVAGVPDPGRTPPPREVPLIGQAAAQMAHAASRGDAPTTSLPPVAARDL